MSEYNEFVSRFPLQEKSVEKEGYEFHHIIPKSEQTEPDDRGVLLLPSEHLWAHVLYDRENGTETSKFIRTKCNLKLEDIHSYEDCLVYDNIAEAHREYCKDWANTHKGREKIPKEEIKNAYESGLSPLEISKKYKISRSYVYQVLDLRHRKEATASKYVTLKDKIRFLEEENLKLQEEVSFFKGILKKLSSQ